MATEKKNFDNTLGIGDIPTTYRELLHVTHVYQPLTLSGHRPLVTGGGRRHLAHFDGGTRHGHAPAAHRTDAKITGRGENKFPKQKKSRYNRKGLGM